MVGAHFSPLSTDMRVSWLIACVSFESKVEYKSKSLYSIRNAHYSGESSLTLARMRMKQPLGGSLMISAYSIYYAYSIYVIPWGDDIHNWPTFEYLHNN